MNRTMRTMSMVALTFMTTTTTTATAMTVTTETTDSDSGSVYPREEWDELLPGCEQTDNMWDTVRCIMQNSPTECFNATTPGDLVECFRN